MRNIPFYLADGPTVDTIIDPAKGIRLRAIDYDTNNIPIEVTRGIDWSYADDLDQASVFASINAINDSTDDNKLLATINAESGTDDATIGLYAYNAGVTPVGLGFNQYSWIEVRSPTTSVDGDISLRADTVTTSSDLIVSGDLQVANGSLTDGTGWTDTGLSWGESGDWSDFGGSEQELQFKRVGDLVFLRGLVKTSATQSNPTTIATLPAGYWPPASHRYAALLYDGGVVTAERVDIRTDGEVILRAAVTNSASNWVDLSGITFSVDS